MIENTSDQIEGAPLIRPSSTDHPLYDPVVDGTLNVAELERAETVSAELDVRFNFFIEIIFVPLGHRNDLPAPEKGIG